MGQKKQIAERKYVTKAVFCQLLFPLIVILGMLTIHLQVPTVYPAGYESFVYPLCLEICAALYAVSLGFACWVPKVRAKMRYLSWLLIALFLAVELLDIMTLKTGRLRLPFVPSPDKILSSITDYWPRVWECFVASMKLWTTGVLYGIVIGLFSGVLMGWSKHCNYWMSPLLKFIGPVPSAAWMPISMVLMPSSHAASLFLIFLSVWFPLTLNLSSAIRNTDKHMIETARVLGAKEWYIMFHVAIPAAVPAIFTGLFMGISSSFGALIVAEMLGVKAGLGWYISWGQSWAEYGRVYSTVLIFIVIFFVIIELLFRIRDRVMKWQKGTVRW